MNSLSAPDSVAADRLRQVMRHIPAAVVVISTGAHGGERYAMTASSFTSVALEPPTILACVNRTASIHEPLQRLRRFCINVLLPEHETIARACASRSGEERFSDDRWRTDSQSGLPYIEGAQAVLFCTLLKDVDVASHAVIIGQVDGIRSHSTDAPLLYLNGRYCSL